MRPNSSEFVPAGKSPKINKPSKDKDYATGYITWLKGKKIKSSFFIVAGSLLVLATLSLIVYLSNYVYVVRINDQEVGIVENPREIERFVADLTERCSDLYGLPMQPADPIHLDRELRPESNKVKYDEIQNTIRQNLLFLTEAYMVTVDGVPVAPIPSEDELEKVIETVKKSYITETSNTRVIDALIVEDIELKTCSVYPENVLSAEEVADLLVEDGSPQNLRVGLTNNGYERGAYSSRQSLSFDLYEAAGHEKLNAAATSKSGEYNVNSRNLGVNVQTIEELKIEEVIPFDTEYIYDDELWIVDKEVTVPGEEGEKEVVYHIVSENGVEVERIKVNERIIKEPVAQVEAYGTAQVPSVGTGQFLWPVEGDYGVTPGRGFSSFHSGIDIHAPLGTYILAADSGVVWFSGQGGSQGLYLIIYHGSYWTLYLHNSVNIASKGDKVAQGQVIAKVGETGRAYGPHLHFEVRRDDGTGEWHTYYQHKPVDPLTFFKP